MKLKHSTSAFTVIEMLIAILIVAVAAAFLLPAMKSVSERTREVECISNLRSLWTGMHVYASEHDGWLPAQVVTDDNQKGTGLQWDSEIAAATGTGRQKPASDGKTIFFCPAAKKCTEKHFGRSYAYNSYLATNLNGSQKLSAINDPFLVALLLEVQVVADGRSLTLFGGTTNITQLNPGNGVARQAIAYRHSGRTNILFVDGHVDARRPVKEPATATADSLPRGVAWANGLAPTPNH